MRVDTQNTEGAEDVPYAIPNVRVDIHQTKYGVPVWWWRSVGHSFNTFAVEVFIDELAHAAGKDPYQFRRDLLKDKPRHLGVLDTAAKAAVSRTPKCRGLSFRRSRRNWNGSLPAACASSSIKTSTANVLKE